MADIADAQITLKQRMNLGSALLWTAKLTGDATWDTIRVPMQNITSAWMTLAAPSGTIQTALDLTWNGTTITFSAPPDSGSVFMLNVLGYD